MARRHSPRLLFARGCVRRGLLICSRTSLALAAFACIAGLPRMRALWDYAAFACTAEFTVFVRTVRLCRVCARLGGSPLSHVPWAFASPVPALGFHCFRMCRGAFAAPVPVLGFASFACAVGIYRTRACFGISPLSHVPWGLCRTRACFWFRLFRMRRGHLPHPCLLWDFAAFACAVGICRTRACFWNFAAFSCTTAFAAPVPAVEFCHFRVHRGLMTRPRSLGALPRPCLRANATSTSAAEF